MSKTGCHSYYIKEYNKKILGVYLVRCNSKKNRHGSITIAVLAPLPRELDKLNLSRVFSVYEEDERGECKEYMFTIKNYIKASAMKIANEIDFNSKEAKVWKSNSYESCDLIACFGSIESCLLYKKGNIINAMSTMHCGFDDAISELQMYGRTTCVDFKTLEKAAIEG